MPVRTHKNKWTSNLTRSSQQNQTSMCCSYMAQRMFKIVLGGWFKTNHADHGCCRLKQWANKETPFLCFFVWFMFWLDKYSDQSRTRKLYSNHYLCYSNVNGTNMILILFFALDANRTGSSLNINMIILFRMQNFFWMLIHWSLSHSIFVLFQS